jgi:menaquinol-cytochrome c reductase iron-sulfur subunit
VNEVTTDHSLPQRPLTPEEITRRRFLEKLCIGLSGVCAAILGIPLVGFVVAPIFRKTTGKWISVGNITDYEIGKTVSEFIAFSVNCTHLGCPVRWLGDADLFMCPCHGGVYYSDGTVAAGPPPKPLIRYDVRTANGQVQIKTMAIPITTTL